MCELLRASSRISLQKESEGGKKGEKEERNEGEKEREKEGKKRKIGKV